MKKEDCYLMLIAVILIMELLCLFVTHNEFEKGVRVGYKIGLKECKRINNHSSFTTTTYHKLGN